MHHSSHPDIIKRLKRAEGHLRKIVSMIEEDRPCLEVAQQLQAVYAAIAGAKTTFVQDHIESCLNEQVLLNSSEAKQKLSEFKEITKYL